MSRFEHASVQLVARVPEREQVRSADEDAVVRVAIAPLADSPCTTQLR